MNISGFLFAFRHGSQSFFGSDSNWMLFTQKRGLPTRDVGAHSISNARHEWYIKKNPTCLLYLIIKKRWSWRWRTIKKNRHVNHQGNLWETSDSYWINSLYFSHPSPFYLNRKKKMTDWHKIYTCQIKCDLLRF